MRHRDRRRDRRTIANATLALLPSLAAPRRRPRQAWSVCSRMKRCRASCHAICSGRQHCLAGNRSSTRAPCLIGVCRHEFLQSIDRTTTVRIFAARVDSAEY